MRLIVTGLDANGFSCVEHDENRPPKQEGVAVMWKTALTPTLGASISIAELNKKIVKGEAKWLVWTTGPGVSGKFHQTDSVDYGIVLAGEIDLILENADVRLMPGDCVVVTGVLHNWRAGPKGCTMSVVMLGSES